MKEEAHLKGDTKGVNGDHLHQRNVIGIVMKSLYLRESRVGDHTPPTRSVSSPRKQVVSYTINTTTPYWYDVLFTLLSYFFLLFAL